MLPRAFLDNVLTSPPPQLTSAYNNLAVELTKTEIKSIGGYTLGRVIGQGELSRRLQECKGERWLIGFQVQARSARSGWEFTG